MGHWGTSDGINFTAPFEVAKQGGMFGNKTLIVTSILVSTILIDSPKTFNNVICFNMNVRMTQMFKYFYFSANPEGFADLN